MNRLINSQEFLSTYNRLDEYMRNVLKRYDAYNIHSSMLDDMRENNALFRNERNYNDLIQYSKLRNAIVHNHRMRYADPIAEPHAEIIKRYRNLVDKLLAPPMALKFAIPANKIRSTSMDAYAIDEMKIMAEKDYTHLPVIQYGNMIGVFSENTVFSFLVKNPGSQIGQDMKIKELADFIDIEKHVNECFIFVSNRTHFFEVEELFKQSLKKNRRIAVVYITENGNVEEKLLGMITPWDLVGHEDDLTDKI